VRARTATLLCATLAALGSWSAGSTASADERAALRELDWKAPAGCPSAADLRALLAERRTDARTLDIHGAIRQESGQYVLELRVDDGGARFARTLRSPDCALLAETAIWLIDLARTQLAASKQTHPRRGPEQAAGARPSSGPAARAPAADTTAEPPRSEAAPVPLETEVQLEEQRAAAAASAAPIYLDSSPPSVTHERAPDLAGVSDHGPPVHLALGAGVGVAGLGLTGAAPELALTLRARRGSFVAGLRSSMVLHSSLALEPNARVSFLSASVEAIACSDLRFGRLRTGPCAVVGGWLTFVASHGLLDARRETALWVNAGAAWRLLVQLHALVQIELEVGATVGLSARPSFTVGGETLAQAAPVAGYGRVAYFVDLW
jgi:hypothetical protein